MTLLLTSSAATPPPPPLDLSDGRNYLVFWSFYQTARGFPKHLEQLMELEWSVTLRVEIGSWKQRHPVRLMFVSDTWDRLSSNPHPTDKGKQLAKSTETLSTPPRASGSCSPGAMPGGELTSATSAHQCHQCPPAQGCGTVLPVGVLVSQTQTLLLNSGCGRSSRQKPVFCKGQ